MRTDRLSLRLGLIAQWLRKYLALGLVFLVVPMAFQARAGLISDSRIVARQFPKLLVLSVGINRYADSEIQRLASSERDALAVVTALTDSRVGMTLHTPAVKLLGEAATKKNILEAARRLADSAEKNDLVVIYWSGHSGFASRDNDDAVLYAYDAVRKTGTGVVSIVDELLPIAASRKDVDFVLIADGCHVGNALYNRVQSGYSNVSIVSASKNDQVSFETPTGSPFANGLLNALRSAASDLDGDGVVSVEEAYIALYPFVVKNGFARQHPSIAGVRVHRIPLVKVPFSEIVFDDPLPQEVLALTDLSINGTAVELDRERSTPTKLVLLGDPSGLLGRGMTYIGNAKQQWTYWREEQALKRFASPYSNSVAVLVAINDYERMNDPMKRGRTGFESRSMMVERAKEIKVALLGLGFQSENIIELYDHQATSQAIDAALKRFWRGAEGDQVDRVVFYFGGHGTTVDGAGLLVTYDFDAKKPTQTSLLMRDLTTRHAESIVAKHLLVTLDACASGLAVYKGLGDGQTPTVPEFQQLSIIRNDTSNKARNFLVAGTGDQPAVWDQGGIFTRALIEGLNGKADVNRDGLIQFGELANYVTNQVTISASRHNVRQQVQSYSLDNLGTGKVLFMQQAVSGKNARSNPERIR